MKNILIVVTADEYKHIQNALSDKVSQNLVEAKKPVPPGTRWGKMERFRHFEHLAYLYKDVLGKIDNNSTILYAFYCAITTN